MIKRKLELVVLSDLHLGTYGCHAAELLQYLRSIEPDCIILNGDIVDIWQFKKSYFPASHLLVLKEIMHFVSLNKPVYYLTGNHDEVLRKFSGTQLGSFKLQDKLVLTLDGKKAWFFHGDVFDVTMRHSKWLARLGAIGYDLLIRLNRIVNYWSIKCGKGRLSFSKRVKDGVKGAIKFINDFEQTAAELAIEKGYSYVVCGHIHQPTKRVVTTELGSTQYLNSGDWIENLTALEYNNGNWQVYQHPANEIASIKLDKELVQQPTAEALLALFYQEELVQQA